MSQLSKAQFSFEICGYGCEFYLDPPQVVIEIGLVAERYEF